MVASHGSCTLDNWQRGPFDTLVWAILGQQISVRAADAIEARLLKTLGAGAFQAKEIHQLDEPTLRSAGLSGAKARTVSHLAKTVVSGELNLDELQQTSEVRIRTQLCALPGIGPWTTEMFLIFGLQRLDIFSPGDLGLRKAIQRVFDHPERPSAARCATIASAWQPYRTIAAWHLWREVD
ncbi:MAG: DNA-3-methyladenine glycosylase 2 family protein [Gammaproteobacteria bacterium]|nr:DNA-3-methyladenine glycosylase 2 family protein [Gammaproteobacteria bacterium]